MAGDPTRPVTRKDVAAAAGTSTAVVSYVLNDGPRPVAPATRQRVLDAVAALGYRPNALAAGLRARRSRLVGLVVPDLSLPFFAEITTQLAAQASRRGWTLLAATSDWDPDREVAAVEEFVRLRVRGLCLAPAAEHPCAERAIRESETPTVLLSGDPGELALPRVASDAVAAGRLATRHLLEHGFDDVTCLSVPLDGTPAGPRVEGWRAELTATAPGSEQRLLRCGFDRYSADHVAGEFLAATTGPVAIMAATDEVALGVLAAAARSGRRVPEDCAVIGCDGIPEGRLTRPRLTTVAQPVEALCAAALDLLDSGTTGDTDDEATGITHAPPPLLPVSLRLGGSCGPHR